MVDYNATEGLHAWIAYEDDHGHGHDEHDEHGAEEPHGDDDHGDHGHGHEHAEGLDPASTVLVLGGYAWREGLEPDSLVFGGVEGIYRFGQSPEEGVPFFGFETEVLDPAAFNGDIELSLLEVEGPGAVVLYQLGSFGEVTFHWDSRQERAGSYAMPAGAHRHFFFAFSAPGDYHLHIGLAAELVDGTALSGTTELRVHVGGAQGYFAPFDAHSGDWLASEWFGWVNVHEWPWVWTDAQGWLHAYGVGGPEMRFARPVAGGTYAWAWVSEYSLPHAWFYETQENGSGHWDHWETSEVHAH
jgi:surface-anchored protein